MSGLCDDGYCRRHGRRLAAEDRMASRSDRGRGVGRLLAAPTVPADFWSAGPIRSALHDRHMGQVVAAYRNHLHHPRPLSQETVGSWLGMTQPQISKLETGPPLKNLDKLTLWARTLQIPRHLLWFTLPDEPVSTHRGSLPDAHSRSALLVPDPLTVGLFGATGAELPGSLGRRDGAPSTLDVVYDRWDAVLRRRAFLAGVGTAAAALFATGGRGSHRSLDLPEALEAHAALTESYWRLEGVLGPGAVYNQAVDHHRQLTMWLQQARARSDREKIGRLVADAGILVGWLHFDLEQYDQASAVYRRTLDVADELDDMNLQAFVVGRMSRTLSECGQHTEAMAFADLGERLAGERALPQVRSWLASTRAFVHASLGDERASRSNLEAAATVLGQATDEPLPTYIAFYGEPNQYKWAGHTLLRLAEHDAVPASESRRVIDQALAIWPASSVRESGEVLSAFASARMAERDVDHAAELTARAHDIAASTGSPRIMRYVLELRQRMAPFRQTLAVQALDEHLLAGR